MAAMNVVAIRRHLIAINALITEKNERKKPRERNVLRDKFLVYMLECYEYDDTVTFVSKDMKRFSRDTATITNTFWLMAKNGLLKQEARGEYSMTGNGRMMARALRKGRKIA